MLRRSVVMVIAVSSLVLALPAARADAPGQVVSSSHGLIATAGVWEQDMVMPDGSSRTFGVSLVVPQGEISATTAMGSVDLARPWTHVSVWKHDNVNHTVIESCRQVANATTWSAGTLNPQHRFTDREYFNPENETTTYAAAWEGVTVDVTCDDGSGYDYYRVSWELDRYSWLTTNPVAVHWAVTPARTWSSSTAQGTTSMTPKGYSTHPVRVCGHRAGGASECYSGSGRVVPMIDDLVVTGRPYTAQVPFLP